MKFMNFITIFMNCLYNKFYNINIEYETRTIERINSNETFIIYLSDDDLYDDDLYDDDLYDGDKW